MLKKISLVFVAVTFSIIGDAGATLTPGQIDDVVNWKVETEKNYTKIITSLPQGSPEAAAFSNKHNAVMKQCEGEKQSTMDCYNALRNYRVTLASMAGAAQSGVIAEVTKQKAGTQSQASQAEGGRRGSLVRQKSSTNLHKVKDEALAVARRSKEIKAEETKKQEEKLVY